MASYVGSDPGCCELNPGSKGIFFPTLVQIHKLVFHWTPGLKSVENTWVSNSKKVQIMSKRARIV